MQKTARKNSSYSKIESILKMAKNCHNAKAIAHGCKILSLGQKLKLPKTCGKRFYKHIKAVLCEKRLEKTAHIRKMRGF